MKFLVVFCLLCVVLIMFFNRAPKLKLPANNPRIIKPCGGTLVKIEEDHDYIHLYWFLGIQDIHAQYLPISGQIVTIDHKQGKLYPAFDLERSQDNKRIITTINSHSGVVIIEQVAGLITAKITNYLQAGQVAPQGLHFGQIYLGSQVVLRLPKTHFDIRNIGEKIGQKLPPGSVLYA